MNITNTMCRLSDLTQEQINSLRDAMPKTCHFTRRKSCSKLGFTWESRAGFWNGDDYTQIVTYTEMMQLLGKTMEFTKSDLKAGVHFTKQRSGFYGLVMGGSLIEYRAVMPLNFYGENLIANDGNTHYDIVGVYKVNGMDSLENHLAGKNLICIWERTEQSPAQKELALLQEQITALQEQAKVLQAKL
ncbi:MAG: hypothetical protein ACJASL_000133 [Paraglaciecola sp.]|jgi:hypothetical protein